MLKRRGVISSTIQRAPKRHPEIDAEQKREISILYEAIEGDIDSFPFGAE
jgi:hypothetical protein